MGKNIRPNTEKVIFVDLFNTAILRKKSAREVLFDYAVAMGKMHGIEPAAIYNLFLKHERRLAVAKWLKTHEAEYKFEEIMTRVADDLFRPFGGVGRAEFSASALPVYIRVEHENHLPNTKLVEFLRDVKNDGVKIYIVSQFYCSEPTVAEWLSLLYGDGLFDGIYVSCDYCKSKRTGSLYRHILNELDLDPKNVLMIGDDRHSDYVMAKRVGLDAIWTKRKEPHSAPDLKKRRKYCADATKLEEIFDENSDMIYANYAFPLYLFEKRLCARLEANGVKDVFFFSREGKFLKRLFDTYCKTTGRGQNIRTHYLCVSRNSLTAAALRPLEEESFRNIKGACFSIMSVGTLLRSLGFDDEKIETLDREIPCNFKRTYPYFYRTKAYKTLIAHPLFRQMYDELRAQNRAAFDLYLNSFGVDISGDIFVADVGWKGSMQKLLQKYLGSTATVHGYYLGAFAHGKRILENVDGLLYSQKDKHLPIAKFFRHQILFYEQICRADHGHVDGYAVKDGKAEILLDELRHDKELHDALFSGLQDRITETFEKLCLLDFDKYSQAENTAMRAYFKTIAKLKRKDYTWRLDAEHYHYDVFCRTGYRHRLLCKPLWRFSYRISNFFFKLRYRARLDARRVKFNKAKTYSAPRNN